MATFKNTRATSLVIERVAGSLGARVKGVQISGNLDEDTIIAIKAALHEHKVIFFRAQTHLNDDEQQRITERLGPPFEMPTLPDDVIARDGAMYELDGSKPDGRAVSWHTDATFCHTPPSASVLRGVVIPPYGGDTQWANCVRALEILPAPLRTLAEQLSVVHTHKVSDADIHLHASQEDQEHFERVTTANTSIVQHPMVHIHPFTGKKSLLLGNYAQQIVDFTAPDSSSVINMFQNHITKAENTVRWAWQAGDVVIWDNLTNQHHLTNDWGTQPRIVRRWTVAGSVPVSVDGKQSVVILSPS